MRRVHHQRVRRTPPAEPVPAAAPVQAVVPVLVVVVAVLVLIAGCASRPATRGAPGAVGPGSTVPGANGAAVPALAWRGCGGDFQCATVTVPLDYRRPTGPTIDLAAIRLPARDRAARLGAVAVNFGGPGAPGVGGLRRLARRFEALRDRLDVVAVDPRGTGSSAPVRCGAFDGEPVAPSGAPPDPGFWERAAEPGRACAAASGELVSHLSTANAARDLDLVRQALGDDRLSVYGYSYGTYLGATYANLFPDHTRALVVDGALDLVANAAGAPGTEDRPVDVRGVVDSGRDDALGGVLDACAAAGPARCALARTGDPRARFADVAAAAVRSGTSAALGERIADAMETTGRLPGLMRSLAALAERAPPSGGVVPPAHDAAVPAHSTSFLAVQCTDSVTPDASRMDAALRAGQAAHPLFGSLAVLSTAACVGWPADPDRYLGPWNAPLSAPTLVVQTRFDPQTPREGARATASQLAASRLLLVDGVGHTTLDAPSRCAQDAVATYLLDPTRLPAEGTECPADAPPFA